MKFLKILIILSLFTTLIGCSTTQKQFLLDSSSIAVESATLKKQYVNIEKLIRSQRDIFTDEEWKKLLNVDSTIDMLTSRYDLITPSNNINLNLDDVKFMWELSAISYEQAREVVFNHWDEFQPSTQVLLHSFDEQAKMTNTKINKIFNDPSNAGINEALVLILGTLSLAVKIVSIGAAII